MRKGMIVLLIFTALLILPDRTSAGCVDLGRFTSVYVQGGSTIIFYGGVRPIAFVDVIYCSVDPSSAVRLLKNYVCDGDKIVVDGEACTVMTISSSPPRTTD